MVGLIPFNKESSYYDGSQEVTSDLTRCPTHAMRETLTPDAAGIVMVMVGLPARGKSFISRRVERFLKWKGMLTRSFNVGKYRRDAVNPTSSGKSDFFDPENREAMEAREAAAFRALNDALNFLDHGGKVAVLDATNSTEARRRRIVQHIKESREHYAVLFVEAICDDSHVLEANMKGKASNSPDFVNMTEEQALEDLKIRIKKYEDVYEPVNDHEGPYIKLFNLSSKVMANHCYGRIAKSVVPYLMAIHIGGRPIFLARAGAGQHRAERMKLGHDRVANLSEDGRAFAVSLGKFVRARVDEFYARAGKKKEPLHVLTSTMPRAIATICYSSLRHEQTSALNPIDKGVVGNGWWDVECEASIPPWEEAEKRHSDFVAQWKKDPLNCRFPGGESYRDVIVRLESLLVEVEMCTRPVLIVSHITVLQLLIAYFKGLPVQGAWQVPVPKGGIIEVTPTSGGGFVCEEHVLSAPREDMQSPVAHTSVVDDSSPDENECSKRQRLS